MRFAAAWWPLVPLLLLSLAHCAGPAALNANFRTVADAEIARAPANYSNGQARAWLVSRDGRERGLLWGTVHIGYGGATVMPREIRARFSDAADLTVESVMDRLPDAELRHLLTTYESAEQRADPDAIRQLDPTTRQALRDLIPPAEQRHLSLRGMAMQVASKSAPELDGGLPSIGFVDLNLIDFARSQGRPVRGLELPQLLDPTLLDPNGPDAALMLAQDLRRASTYRAMGDWVSAAYGQGDIAGALALLTAWQAQEADLEVADRDREPLFAARNRTWLPVLTQILEQPGTHFIAVGAGHLLGTDGLVALLRAHRFAVTPCPGDACG